MTSLEFRNRDLTKSIRDTRIEKYAVLVDSLPIAVYYSTHVNNKSSTIMSHQWEAWTGYPSEILYEQPNFWMKAVHPDDLKRIIKEYYNASKKQQDYEIQYRVIHKATNEIRYLRDRGRFYALEREGMTAYNGFISNITEQILAEKKTEEIEKKYQKILENTNDLIGVLTKSFKYEYINEKAFMRILGYASGDIIDKSALDFVHPDDINKAIDAMKQGFIRGYGSAEIRFKHKNGSWVWLEANGKVYKEQKGRPRAIVISRDITEKKKAEQEIIDSQENYRMSYDRANFYKDLFAHDINNILHIINSAAELINYAFDRGEIIEEIKNLPKMILKQVKRGTKLVENVRTLSKLEEQKIILTDVDLCEILHNSIDYVKKAYDEKDIDIKLELCKKSIIISANELLQDIIENLLINSIKYNESDKIQIDIIIKEVKVDEKEYYRAEFIDNGIGILEDRKNLIFEPGEREIKGKKGMGLGLSLVKRILQIFKGKIWVENKFEDDFSKGSKFIILLPK